MSTATITYSRTLTVVDCYKCAIVFAVPDDFDRMNRERGRERTWYCPNGHGQVYSVSQLDKAKKRADELAQQIERANARIVHEVDQRKAAERQVTAYKGTVTRMKKRTAAGVCPCCQRTFQQLARHMAGQHPGYQQEATS